MLPFPFRRETSAGKTVGKCVSCGMILNGALLQFHRNICVSKNKETNAGEGKIVEHSGNSLDDLIERKEVDTSLPAEYYNLPSNSKSFLKTTTKEYVTIKESVVAEENMREWERRMNNRTHHRRAVKNSAKSYRPDPRQEDKDGGIQTVRGRGFKTISGTFEIVSNGWTSGQKLFG